MSGCDCRCHHESACGQSPECFPGVQQPHTPLDKEERILVLNQSELDALLTERLAQAEAKVERVKASLKEWGHEADCESLTCFKGDGSTREPGDCDCYYAEFAAALSGDADPRTDGGK